LSQHKIEAEEFHLLDTLAALALDVHVEGEAASGSEGDLKGPVTALTVESPAVAVKEFDGSSTYSLSLIMRPPTVADHLSSLSGDLIIGIVDLSALTEGINELVTFVTETVGVKEVVASK
jgi:hypothetical protein